MNQHAGYERAGLWRRAAARAIDALVMAVAESVMVVVVVLAAAFITRLDIFSDERWRDFLLVFVLLMLLASIPVVRYEVASTARRGQTFGKRCMGIRVVQWNDEGASSSELPCPAPPRSLGRWAVPHGAGLFAAVVAGWMAFQVVQGYGAFYGISGGAGMAAWTVVYLSSLLDKDRRGWHDKAAGTIVVTARDTYMEV